MVFTNNINKMNKTFIFASEQKYKIQMINNKLYMTLDDSNISFLVLLTLNSDDSNQLLLIIYIVNEIDARFFATFFQQYISGPAVVVGVTLYVLSISSLSEVEMVQHK